MFYKYTAKQFCILLIYSVVNILCASSVSIQGPFYPPIAEKKGVTPTQYGFVLGVFNIGVFIVNPVIGMLIGKFGAVRISVLGLSTIGMTSILFGFVNKIMGFSLFFGMSVIIRIFEAIGFAMARNASIVIVSCEFIENIDLAIAIINTCFSLGQFLGPVTGGALFELGGFFLPFVTVGVFLLCSAFVILFLPKNYPKSELKSTKKILLRMHQIPQVILGIFTVFGVNFNFGLLLATLEPHLKNLHLSPVQIGSMFLCNAITFGISSIIWGKVCEKYNKLSLITSISALIIICGLLLLGPAPYIPLEKSTITCVIGLLIHGLGSGGEQVAGFSSINNGAKQLGLPKDTQTYGIVSAIFTSSVALGYVLGTLLGGYFFEEFGFPWASHFFISYQLLLFIGLLVNLFFRRNEENLKNTVSSNKETKF